jgi:threonine dehydratase
VITREDIHRAYDAIRPYLRRTPVVQLDLTGPVTLKLEQLQCAGSFKARGAFTNLLLRDVPPAGVAAASGGNHGVAVAYAAHRLGIPARIFVPTVSSPAKIDRIRQLADLVIGGDRYADALEAARALGAMAAVGSLRVRGRGRGRQPPRPVRPDLRGRARREDLQAAPDRGRTSRRRRHRR